MVAPLAGLDPAERSMSAPLRARSTDAAGDGHGACTPAVEVRLPRRWRRRRVDRRRTRRHLAQGAGPRRDGRRPRHARRHAIGSAARAVDAAAAVVACASQGIFIGLAPERGRLRDLGERALRPTSCHSCARALGPVGDGLSRRADGGSSASAADRSRRRRRALRPSRGAPASQLRRPRGGGRRCGHSPVAVARALRRRARDAAAAQVLVEARATSASSSMPNDPMLRIDACPGAPACRSSSVDTRRDARRSRSPRLRRSRAASTSRAAPRAARARRRPISCWSASRGATA